jgi:hypothetical protein
MTVRFAALCLVCVPLFGGCGKESGPSSSRPHLPVDEMAGTFRGVGIGDARETILREFGRSPRWTPPEDPVEPLGEEDANADLGMPWVVAPPRESQPRDGTPRGRPFEGFDVLRYREGVFSLYQRVGVYRLTTVQPGSRTRRGVEIGDSLNKARQRYPSLRCGIRNEDSEYVEYPYCTGRLARGRFIWLGQDPIRSITVATRAMG